MTRKKGRARKRAKSTTKSPLPDLSQILDNLREAYSLVWTAHRVMIERYHGHEEVALRLGVEALQRVCEQLDHAASALSRYSRATGGVS